MDKPGVSHIKSRSTSLQQMQKYLAENVYAGHVHNGCFWPEEGLEQLWLNDDLVGGILKFDRKAELRLAQQNFFRILSILIYIGEFDQETFKACFFRHSDRTDAYLPFDLGWLSTELGRAAGQKFFEQQLMAKPLTTRRLQRFNMSSMVGAGPF